MAIKFLDKIKGIPSAFQNAMLGTPVQVMQPQSSINNAYPQNISDFVSNMKTQEWAQPLFNKQTGYTDNQLVERIGNGLNDGYKQIADFQTQNDIRIPQTGEEKYLASVGEFNQYPQIQTGIANIPRQGGIINDFMTGARENYNEGFSSDNWGQKKNLATKAGEFIGSVGRFADSAPGRALIAGGLIGALGGTPAEMAAYGLSAGVGRQQNRAQDQLYRQQLKQLGYTDEDLGDIGGNVTKDMFEGITSGLRLGNQRITYGQLAMFDDEVAEMVKNNPLLANQFVPVTLARDVYGKKREKTEADIKGTEAKTEKTKAETGQVGKPKVTVNIKQGGTKSVVEYRGGSGGKGGNSYTRPTKTKKTIDYKSRYGLE